MKTDNLADDIADQAATEEELKIAEARRDWTAEFLDNGGIKYIIN
jgi:hypothetical protein